MQKGIILDMDGTLWDSARQVAESWNAAIARFGLSREPLSESDIRGVMGMTMDEIADALFPELPPEKRGELLSMCCEEENAYLRERGGTLYPGVEETIRALRDGGWHISIVSNCQEGYIEAFLDYYGLGGFVDDKACYGERRLGKAENIRLVIERNGLGRAVYVGDTMGDYEASQAAGAGFVYAAYGFGSVGGDVPRISSFSELAGHPFLRETKLEELLSCIRRGHVYIQTHNFPDPDAIASAYGMQRLLEREGVRSTICYKGKIDRYSTGKLLELIGIELADVDALGGTLMEDDEVILVDAQRGNTNIIDIAGDEIICVDHHPVNDRSSYRFSDIRPDVGACATIIASYFRENGIPMDWRVATALTYAIRVDTNNLMRRVSRLDMEMLTFLYDECDFGIIHTLEHSNLCFRDLLAYSSAIESIRVFDCVSFADAGSDCPEALIASVSDFMLALVEVSFSVVYSRRADGFKLSVRSERDEWDAGVATSRALEGIGSGGGHASMAGGFVPFSGGREEADALSADIRRRFLAELGIDSDGE